MTPTAAAGGPAAFSFFLVFLVFAEDPVTGCVGTLRLLLEILIQLGELILLLRRQPVCLRAEQLPFQLGDLSFGLGELLVVLLRQGLQLFQQLTQGRVLRFLGHVRFEEFVHLCLQSLVRCPEFLVAHDESSLRNPESRG